jgi:hypothetical protein
MGRTAGTALPDFPVVSPRITAKADAYRLCLVVVHAIATMRPSQAESERRCVIRVHDRK